MADDDDAPALSAETFAALQEFYAEQAKREEIFQKLQAEDKLKENVLFDENWGDHRLRATQTRWPRQRGQMRGWRGGRGQQGQIPRGPYHGGQIPRGPYHGGQIPRGPRSRGQTPHWPRQRGQIPHWPQSGKLSVPYTKEGVPPPADDVEHQDEFDDWSSLAKGNQRVKRQEKTGLAHHRRYETDTLPTASTSYGINEELDINHENYAVLGKTSKRVREEKGKTKSLRFWMAHGYTYEEASEKCTRQHISPEYHETIARQHQADKNKQSYSSSADDGVESDDLASFFKERYIKYPSQKKLFAFWMDYGYTREEAANRCFRALKEFPEYHEMKGFPGENAMKLNESNKSGKRTYDRAPYNKDQSEDIASPSPNSTHKKPSSSKIDPNYLRKLEKKRKLFWLNHGYSLEEAEARCHRELKEFPEFKQLKAAGETATFSAANKLKFYDFEDRKTKKPISTHNEITIGIIDDNNVITNDKIKLIEKEIIRCMDFTSASPNFTSYTIKKGCLILACEDGDTRDWLVDNIANFKPWEGASLRVIEEDELPSPIWAIIKTRDKVQPQTLLNRLTVQNEEVGCDRWKFHHVKQGDKLQACFFRIDSKSEDILRQNMRKLFLGLGIIRVHINKNPGFKKVRD